VIALAQASADYHVILGSRSVAKGQKALGEQQAKHADSLRGSISVVQMDVTDRASIAAAKESVSSSFGRLDVLVNNAGIIVTRPDDTLTILRELFETNTFGPAIVTETFEPLLRASSRPRLAYVTSGLGSITNRLDPTQPFHDLRGDWYRMSKAALNMLAACHRHNLADFGCKVVVFDPGYCVTNLTGEEGRKMRVKMGARDARDAALALADIVLGRKDAEADKSGILDVDGNLLPW
jgi:NAD(P)-dependent dehydrogenase (short-subunit alcohol dehydrogenase family)